MISVREINALLETAIRDIEIQVTPEDAQKLVDFLSGLVYNYTSRKVEEMRETAVPMPQKRHDPTRPWTLPPYPGTPPVRTCVACGITLHPVMAFACSRADCPSGLGGGTRC